MRPVMFIFVTLNEHKDRHTRQNQWLKRVQPLPERNQTSPNEESQKPIEAELAQEQ